ncbi:hypothetical protein Angca_007026, partial [Angiostrongylus cantonensis]
YDNLDAMLKKYEHWAHCMFPKLKFEDVVNRCEHLGEKRAVYMTKFRLGMPLTDEDFASVRRRKGDEIIETENNEDYVISRSQQYGSDNDENYYDPLQLATSQGKHGEAEVFATSTLSVTTSSKVDFSSDILDDMMVSAIEARKIALEEERKRKEEEALAMADEVMADFDMY